MMKLARFDLPPRRSGTGELGRDKTALEIIRKALSLTSAAKHTTSHKVLQWYFMLLVARFPPKISKVKSFLGFFSCFLRKRNVEHFNKLLSEEYISERRIIRKANKTIRFTTERYKRFSLR